jgi:hypothetical protein
MCLDKGPPSLRAATLTPRPQRRVKERGRPVLEASSGDARPGLGGDPGGKRVRTKESNDSRNHKADLELDGLIANHRGASDDQDRRALGCNDFEQRPMEHL